MALAVKNPPANAGKVRNLGSIPGSERSPGRGNGNPLQYSCLENPMDRGAWRAMVHRVAESWTCLKQLSALTHTHKSSPFPKGKPIFPKRMPAFLGLLSWPWLWGAQDKNSVGCHKLQRLIPTVIIPHFPSKLAIHFLGHRTCPYTLIPCWPLCRLRTRPGLSPSSENAQVQASTEAKHTPNKQPAIFFRREPHPLPLASGVSHNEVKDQLLVSRLSSRASQCHQWTHLTSPA